jgi:acetyltransferase-like isoleucine patch superfamily enzyme
VSVGIESAKWQFHRLRICSGGGSIELSICGSFGLDSQDTLLLWLFYWLMGAKIHPSVKLGAFVREFDLVKNKEEAYIDYHIQCRKFGPWKDEEEGPRLSFRRISVQKNSVIGGMLSPGVTIGEAAKVEESSVVFEGAQVPEGILVAGNPAFVSGKKKRNAKPS